MCTDILFKVNIDANNVLEKGSANIDQFQINFRIRKCADLPKIVEQTPYV